MRSGSNRRILEPIDRVSEVLFGLIMVLTFTGSLSAAEAGQAGIRAMLVGALGCNLAWGIIDGVMYLMACLAEQGRDRRTWRAVRESKDRSDARQVVADALPPVLSSVLLPAELDAVSDRLRLLSEPSPTTRLGREAWLGALAVFLWVFVSTLPVVIPFLLVGEGIRALRISNAVALGMLYLTGHALGRITGHRRWVMGLSTVAIGAVLVAMTIALGG
ncbi:MAG TPA: VIT1/CCC1 transporter family protein [Vicinamibacteria bacterium]|nr:VIT1/CCC1 transporter family protein [Vicinamibacteria bacterium]